MKTLTKLSIVLTIVGMCFGLSKSGFSQGVGDHITMFLDSCVGYTDSLEFGLYIVSDGTASSDLRMNSSSYGINFNTSILPSGDVIVISYVPGTTDTIYTSPVWNFPVSAFPNHIRLTQSPATSNSGITMTIGHVYRAGRFRLKTSSGNPWTTGSHPNFVLQDVPQGGHTNTLALLYIGTASSSTIFNTTGTGDGFRSVSTNCSITLNPPCLNIVADSTDVSCYLGNDGTASVTANSGSSPYTYVWSDGETFNTVSATNTISTLIAGTYCVTVTDNTSCSASACVTITQPLQPTFSCYITNDTVDVTHKIYTFDLYLINTSTNNTAFEYAGGQWGILINSAVSNGGTLTPSIVAGTSQLSNTNQVPNSVGLPSTYCFNIAGTTPPGCGNGSIISTSGVGNCINPGTRIATFKITNSNTFAINSHMNAKFNFVSAANLTQTEIFSYLCCTNTNITPLGTFYDTIPGTCLQNINLNPAVCSITESTTITPPSCFGGNNGTATVSTTGAFGALTYLWNNGQTTSTATGLTAGTYTVTVTDNGIANCTASATATVTQPAVLNASSSSGTIACNGGSTTVTVTGSGGTSPYSGTGSFTRTAGTFSFIITDNNGCTATTAITLTQPTLVVTTSSANPILCNGGSTTVTVTGAGGTAPYSGTGNFSKTAGTYSFTVTDSHGCTGTTSITLTQPTAVTASSSAGNITCNGGSTIVTITASGGTPPYIGIGTFTESAGPYSLIVTDNNGCTATASGTITQPGTVIASASQGTIACIGGSTTVTVTASGGIAPYIGTGNFTRTAGAYSFIVTDNHGCTGTASITVTQPAALSASCSATGVLCNGGNTGGAYVIANGGTSPYSYLWNTGATTSSISGLTAHTYLVTITDSHSCTAICTSSVTEPSAVSANCGGTAVTIHGGSNGTAYVTASGGTLPYTYHWFIGASTSSISGLSVGNYCVTVTDRSFCTSTCCFTVTQPTAVSASCGGTPVACHGGSTGSASVTATGGTSPYSYSWNTGDTASVISNLVAGPYFVTVTDSQNSTSTCIFIVLQPSALTSSSSAGTIACNGSSTSITVTASGGTAPYLGTGIFTNTAGSYFFIVTDNNGCSSTTLITITEPSAITANCGGTAVTTNGGSNGTASVSAGGGSPGYTYLWTTGATTSSISGLIAGNYCVTIADILSCSTSCCFSVIQPNSLIVSCSGQAVRCNGENNGSTSVTASTGVAPYTYSWSNGATASHNINLTAGTYCVTVTDANSATGTCCFTVTEPTSLSAPSSSGAIACNGGSTIVNITVVGGTPPYIGTGNFIRTAGSYSFSVTDGHGCTTSTSVTITQPTVLTVTVSSIPASSCSSFNGSVSATATGGTTPYTYNWSNGVNTSSQTGLSQGNYNVTITDHNGCSITSTDSVACIVEVSDLEGNEKITIFPNPASDLLTVTFSDDAANSQIIIYTLLGEKVGSYFNAKSQHSVDINIADKPNGIYIITVTNSNSMIRRKFVKYSE